MSDFRDLLWATAIYQPILVVKSHKGNRVNLARRYSILMMLASYFIAKSARSRVPVWMSHGDHITALPANFKVIATTEGAPFAAIADDENHYYGVQFHPEVVHSAYGSQILQNFAEKIAKCQADWTMEHYAEQAIQDLRAQIGENKVICALSGGVDSSVAAILVHRAVGKQLTCIFVDHGLLRAGEGDASRQSFS